MKIIVLDPRAEVVVRSMPVWDKDTAQHCEQAIKRDEVERGGLERIILSEGTARFLERGQSIPVPLQSGKVLR
jgi:tellurite resistance-related uncharacterized protein